MSKSTFKRLSTYGVLYELDQFIYDCKNNIINDKNGIGYYVTNSHFLTEEEVIPSEVLKNNYKDYEFVLWLKKSNKGE